MALTAPEAGIGAHGSRVVRREEGRTGTDGAEFQLCKQTDRCAHRELQAIHMKIYIPLCNPQRNLGALDLQPPPTKLPFWANALGPSLSPLRSVKTNPTSLPTADGARVVGIYHAFQLHSTWLGTVERALSTLRAA